MILGLIPARGGSKGIPNKNIKLIADTPLIDFTINAAKQSKRLDAFVVSTDCQKIYSHIAKLNVIENGLRPSHLATDTAKTIDTVLYELEKYEKDHNIVVDTVVLLQPTAPLRTAEDIDKAIAIYEVNGQPSLISCYDAESVHPNIMYINSSDGLIPYNKDNIEPQRRQDMEKVYVRNGAIYITDRAEIVSKNRLVSDTPSLYQMPRSRSVNIDSQEDIHYANFFFSHKV